jgi:hypothetical protein
MKMVKLLTNGLRIIFVGSIAAYTFIAVIRTFIVIEYKLNNK